MQNPFVYGKVVTGEYFVDRENEIKELKSSLLSGQHIVLFSPRKMGKTSLIKETFGRIDEVACVYIDLWQTLSTYALAKGIINSTVGKTYTSLERLGHDLKDLFKSLRPRVSIDVGGHISVEFSREEVREALEDALNFPERVARRKGKLVIAFDEFQEIKHLDGLEMEKTFRSVIQHHQHVSYLFAGSETSLIDLIFGERERPFYRFAKPVELKPIREDILEKFILDRFSGSGKKITREAARWIAGFSKGVPYYVQHMCHEVWYRGDPEADVETVENCLTQRILPSLSSGFQTIWNRIKSDEQRMLLIGLANEPHPQIYSRAFIERYQLRSPGNVRKAVKSLEKVGLMERKAIQDLFFREWVKTNFSF